MFILLINNEGVKSSPNVRSHSRYSVNIFLINMVAVVNHKKPHHPSKVQVMNCLTAYACGPWLSLLFITLQGYTSFRHLTFQSVHCQPPASTTRARVLPSFHSIHACRRSIPLPFGCHVTQSKWHSQNEILHFTQPNSLYCIQSPPLLYLPNQR